MTVYFTSDLHYGHTNIVGSMISRWTEGYRDFQSLEEMNSTIVKSINDNVSSSDVLYFLGDWAFGGDENIKKLREQIYCNNIHMILGNHDKWVPKYKNLFSSINSYLEITLEKKNFILCHYPMRVWNGSHRNNYHLYGHCHHSILNFGKSMDIGWCEYRKPLSLEEIIDKLKDKKIGEYWGQEIAGKRTNYKKYTNE